VELELLVPVWAPPQDCKLLFWYDQLPWPKLRGRGLFPRDKQKPLFKTLPLVALWVPGRDKQ
jgi:hypothetical protein